MDSIEVFKTEVFFYYIISGLKSLLYCCPTTEHVHKKFSTQFWYEISEEFNNEQGGTNIPVCLDKF